jgi:hypothetical protein
MTQPQGERRIRVEKFFKDFLPIDGGRIKVGVRKELTVIIPL